MDNVHARYVTAGWSKIQENVKRNGIRFFEHIFETASLTLPGYKFTEEQRAALSTDLKYSAMAQQGMFDTNQLVEQVNDAQKTAISLQSYAQRFSTLGIAPDHLEIIRKAAISFMGEALGEVWTDTMKEAWTFAIDLWVDKLKAYLIRTKTETSTTQLVQHTWALVEKDLEGHAVKFFLKIFEIAPEALQLFSFKDDAGALEQSPSMKKHAMDVMFTVGSAVAGLNDIKTLIPVLEALGGRHAQYGVQSAHFAIVGQALLWTLEQGLGDAWTPQVKEAWTKTYTTIEKVMEPALREAAKTLHLPKITSVPAVEAIFSNAVAASDLQAPKDSLKGKGPAELVQSTWSVVAQDMERHGIRFFHKVFEIAPPLLALFSFKDDGPLAQSPAFKKHAVTVMTTIGTAVAGLSDVRALFPVLEALGARHASYGVKAEHFPIVGKALLWTLEQGLGELWTVEVEDAWTKTYSTVVRVMQPALERGIAEQAAWKGSAAAQSGGAGRPTAGSLKGKGATELVQETWKLMAQDLEGHGIKFFLKIFEIAPPALALFSFKDEVPLEQSPGMKKHAIGVLTTVGEAVAGLSNVKTLIPVLEALGGRHAEYGVQPEHFAVVGQALLWTLEQGLGDLWTDKVQESWSMTYGAIQKVMEPALRQEIENREKHRASPHKGKGATQLVQETWSLVAQDLEGHGIKFFLKIFEIAPPALALFSFKDEVPLEQSPGMKKHAMDVMFTVGSAVAGLSDVKSLIPVLEALGGRHANYGVQPEHFAIIGQALLWTLEQGLGELWTVEVKDAWIMTYAAIQKVMEPSLRKAIASLPPPAPAPVAIPAPAAAPSKPKLQGRSPTELVRETWAMVAQDLEGHGIKFFLKIFEIAPPALQLFSFKDEVPLEQSPGMKKHAIGVLETVGSAVAGLSDVNTLIPVLEALGGRHAEYGVQPEHFAVVGQALLWTLEQGLGEYWTPAVQDAWTKTYGTIQQVMSPALVRAHSTLAAAAAAAAAANARPALKGRTATELVQETWVLVEAKLEAHAIKFFLKIFEIAPPALQLFSFKDVVPLEQSEGMKMHAVGVMRTVGSAVAGLTDVKTLIPVLEELGGRHAEYGVQPEHFAIVGQALLWTLEQGLGELWTPEVNDAWSKTYTTITAVMQPALLARAKVEGERDLEDPVVVKELVQTTWTVLERQLQAHGVKFFLRVFAIAPDLLQLFSFKDETPLEHSAGLKRHAITFMQTVGKAVAGLSDVQALIPILVGLGGRHAGYGVQPEHFTIFGEALVWTLEEGLGELWTHDVKVSWIKTYEAIHLVMEPPLRQVASTMAAINTPEPAPAPVPATTDVRYGQQQEQRAAVPAQVAKPASPRKKTPIELVQETWKLVAQDLEGHGIKFFLKIFEIAPEALELFSFKDEVPLEQSPGMIKHAMGVMNTVGSAVAGLTDVKSLIPVLEALGGKHAKYGVQPEHFAIIGQALLWTLEQGLGELWTPEVEGAWTKTYGTIQSVMEPALTQAAAVLHSSKCKLLVERTWHVVAQDMEGNGVKLFLRVFEVSSEALQLFSFRNDKPLDKSPALRKHALMFMHLMGKIIRCLDNVDEVVPMLKDLGEQHAVFGVMPEHFIMLGKSLFWMLKQALGHDWDKEVNEAWIEAYASIQSVMEHSVLNLSRSIKRPREPKGDKRVTALVKETWRLVNKKLEAHAVKFFLKIFEIAPSALALFSFKEDASRLADSPGMKKHAIGVMRTVGDAVAGLSDVKTLIPVLEALGGRHAEYGVQPEHFAIVGQALLWTLEQALGELWTPDVKEAWTKTYGTIQSVMEPALKAGYASPKKAPAASVSLKGRTPVELVQETWSLVAQDLEGHGIKFFLKIFEIAPTALALFSFKDDAGALERSPGMKKHAMGVMNTVGEVVVGLQRAESLVPVLEALGKRHGKYGVQPEHFAIVGKALLWTLEQGLGELWTPEVEGAWVSTYDGVIAKVMIPALALKSRAESVGGESPMTTTSTDVREGARMRQVVQDTWVLVANDLEGSSVMMFLRLFESSPAMLQLFPFADDKPLRTSVGLKKHAMSVMNALGDMVSNINDIRGLIPALESQGRRHAVRKMQPEHLTAIGDALMWTLENVIGNLWTEEVREAWEEAWESMRAVMEPSLKDQIAELQRIKSSINDKDVDAMFLVQDTWELISKDLEPYGIQFFLKIFEIAPSALELFSFKDDADRLAESPGLRKHAMGVLSTVGDAVAGLSDVASLVPVLDALGGRHAQYGVQPEHFVVVGEALLWVLGKALGDLWTGDVREAWEQTYATIQTVMEPAMMRNHAKLAGANLKASLQGKSAKEMVQETWVLVEDRLEAHAIKFFLKIFEIAPPALQLFSFKDEVPLKESPGMKLHAVAVMRTVGDAVAGLSNTKTLVPVLEALGGRHAEYGVQPEHFAILGQALLWTLEQALGELWMPEVKAAWEETYGMVRKVMEPALVKASKKQMKGLTVAALKSMSVVDMIQSTWRLVEQDLKGHGIKFFLKIFEIAPPALQLFSFKDEVPLEKSPGMIKHAMGVLETVGSAVSGLTDVKTLIPVLEALGGRHAEYGVQPEHFAIVGQALLWTLEQGLGELWIPQVKDAWTKTYGTVQAVMSPALVRGIAALPKPKGPTELVQETWKLVAQDLEGHGIKFFLKIFEIAPPALQLFSFKDEVPLEQSEGMKKHAIGVLETVGTAVAGLTDVKTLIPVLEALGGRHAEYGVQPEHFAIVGQALLWTLEQGLGELWTVEVKEAWTKTYGTVQAVMEPALKRGIATKAVVPTPNNTLTPASLRGMSSVDLVRETWKLVAQDLEGHGVKFFLKIFEIAPPALALFSFKDEVPLEQSPGMKKHAMGVMDTVGTAVAGLTDVKTLIPVLEALGGKHAKYGVQPEHFAIVGQALLWTLEQGLGELWTPEVKDAWTKTYGTVQAVMEPALVRAHRSAELPPLGRASTLVAMAALRGKPPAELVQSTWKFIASNLEAHAIKFFLKIFEIAPPALALFSFKDEVPLEKSPGMIKHAVGVMKTVGEAVAGLSDVKTLVPVLHALGARHSEYGVQPEHFAIVGQALLWTLEQGLEDLWISEVKDAWTKTYGTVQAVMEPALVAANKKKKAQPKAAPAVDLKGKSPTELVQATWVLVEAKLEAHAIKFFLKIFEIAPPALALFSFMDEEPLEQSPGMKKHAIGVLKTVGSAVAGLTDVKSLIPVLEELGGRHAEYGVQPEHFAIVGQALLWTLEQGLGELWTVEVKEAWTKTYGTVQAVMEPALVAANKRKKAQIKAAPAVDLKGKSPTELVQATWVLVEAKLEAHAIKFFLKIFEIAPPALALFSFKGDAGALERSPGMKKHAMGVLKTVGTAVAGLNDVASLVPVLEALGGRHAEYGVQPEHFAVVGQALLWTLEQGLGELWTPEVKDAWSKTYGTVQAVMEPALVRAHRSAELPPLGRASTLVAMAALRGKPPAELVQSTWKFIASNLEAHAIKFFLKIFEIAPPALALFSFKDEVPLEKSPGMIKHAVGVMKTVGEAVAGLSDVKTLVPVLHALGARHSEYGVQPEHFAIVGQALLWTLEQGLEDLWISEVKDAWTKTYGTVQAVMEPALVAANKKKKAQPKAAPAVDLKGKSPTELVQATWVLVEAKLEAHAIKFFLKIFEIAPPALALFSFMDEEPLEQSPGMKKHAIGVLKTVGSAVAGLTDVKSLIPVLEELGGRHAEYGVQPEHFAIVGQALLWTLEQGLGELWTVEVKEAWTKTYGTVQAVMEPALVAANKRKKAQIKAAPAVDLKGKSPTELVQATWVLVEAKLEAHAIKFFLKIFEIAPPALALFSFKGDAGALERSPGMKKHAMGVLKTVGTAVAGLNDVASLVPVLEALGGRHAEYGVQPEHFAVVGQALLWTLEQGLGELWTPEVKDAWSKTYGTVQAVMEPALVRATPALKGMASSSKEEDAEYETIKGGAVPGGDTSLVQETWSLVAQDLEGHGIKFFLKIFEIAPPALQLFSFRRESPLENSPGMRRHATGVLTTVGEAVAGLSDVKTLLPVLEALGGRHAEYGVQPEHFAIVGQALLWTLEQGLGKRWTPEVKDVWTKTYGTIAKVMEHELMAQYAVKKKVRESWELVEQDLEAQAVKFFMRMVEVSPTSLQLFSFKGARDLPNHPGVKRHSVLVMQTIGQLLTASADIDMMAPALESMGHRHAKQYGVMSDQMEIMLEALLWTVARCLGPKWDADVEGAWREAYEKVVLNMMPLKVV